MPSNPGPWAPDDRISGYTSTAYFHSLGSEPPDIEKGIEIVRTDIVTGSLSWITKCRPVDVSICATLLHEHPLPQLAATKLGIKSGIQFDPDRVEYKQLYPQDGIKDLYFWILTQFSVCQIMLDFVVRNCKMLQASGLARDYISALVLEPLVRTDRINVVKLKRLVIEDLFHVAESFAAEIQAAWAVDRLHKAEFSRIQERLNATIRNLGLWDDDVLFILAGISLQQGRVPEEIVIENHTEYFSNWRGILEILDLIVISYAYAHVDDVSHDFPEIKDYGKYLPTEGLESADSSDDEPRLGPVQLQMLPLSCLAKYLRDRKVLVFGSASEISPRSELYLSTNIQTFADVWGPVWQVHDPKYPEVIVRYNSGGGSIVPWKHNFKKHPGMLDNERLCHWKEDFEDMSSEIEDGVGDEPGFVQNAQLLIGAGGRGLEWRRCRCSIDNMTQYLKEHNRLGFLMPSEAYRELDSYQTSLVLGSHGAQFGVNRTVKDKKMNPLKISILERWENERNSRNPHEFLNYWSVAISLCNMNAERVRLVRVLGEDSVLALLENFHWSDWNGQRRSFIFENYKEAVWNEDPKALGRLWNSFPNWRQDIGDAILVCLRVLARTGYRSEYKRLYALWLPPNCSQPRKVMLELGDQNWIPFLKDTTISMTTAVIVEDSFGRCSKEKRKKPSLWFMEPSILETAVCVNQSIRPSFNLERHRSHPREGRQIEMSAKKHRRVWSSMWNVNGLHIGSAFEMNTQVTVRVKRHIDTWQLLLEVQSRRPLDILGWAWSRGTRETHWEYTDEVSETSEFQPIPVTIGKDLSNWRSIVT